MTIWKTSHGNPFFQTWLTFVLKPALLHRQSSPVTLPKDFFLVVLINIFFSFLTILIELTFNFFLPDNSEFNSSQLNAQTLLVSAWRTVKEVIHQKWINWMNKFAKQILFCKKGGSFIWSNIIVDAWDKFSIF